MSSPALTSENSAIVMIDHAVGFGNVFRSHDLSLHVTNTVGTVIRVTLSHDLSSGTITSTITSPLFDDPTTAAKYGDELALPNGRYDLGLPPPFGPGAPPGTTFNVVVVPAY